MNINAAIPNPRPIALKKKIKFPRSLREFIIKKDASVFEKLARKTVNAIVITKCVYSELEEGIYLETYSLTSSTSMSMKINPRVKKNEYKGIKILLSI
tara:strand:+ start:1937 stop:2230 length:294 start_codon:yes stop_codon:yes gene_type:complete